MTIFSSTSLSLVLNYQLTPMFASPLQNCQYATTPCVVIG